MADTKEAHYLRDDRQSARVSFRKKKAVDVELILQDGDTLSGQVYLSIGERVLDMLNASGVFFPLRIESGEILLINKTYVAVSKPLDDPI